MPLPATGATVAVNVRFPLESTKLVVVPTVTFTVTEPDPVALV